jgi:hypothetical protein
MARKHSGFKLKGAAHMEHKTGRRHKGGGKKRRSHKR